MKTIEQYTTDELSAKIEAIKAEREKTANALKRYEEELERRKRDVPLGVPLNGTLCEIPKEVICRDYTGLFLSKESADRFEDYLKEFVKALQDIAEGEPIDIKVLCPLLKKGWVAMDESGYWYWYKSKPSKGEEGWITKDEIIGDLVAFNLKHSEDWRNSLMECGL